jgi:hypothetical protein
MCLFFTHLNNGRSRQWSGGSENKVLSFNGFPSDPNKYVENAISTRQFRLKIFNTSEADVNCYYKCVYGFKFDEKMLDLNTMRYQFILIPNQLVFALSPYCSVLSREATNTNVIVFV